jgi:hypothetical protein
MARSTYTFGGRTFTSREKVRFWMAEIRAAYLPGETITEPLHVRAVTDLLQCHVDRQQKIGAGIKRLFVNYAPDQPSLCFWVERIGGAKTDFGVPACLQGIGVLNRQSFRQLIRPAIEEFRRRRIGHCLTFVSDFSGKTFSVSEAHVDHEVPFDDIIATFAKAEEISVETELLTKSCDASSIPVWIEPKLAQRFIRHHAKYPLRLVQRRENLSDIKLETKHDRARVSPSRRALRLKLKR